jgi:hypothetical protein
MTWPEGPPEDLPFRRPTSIPLPSKAHLRTYADIDGGYTDCYAVDIEAELPLSDYVTGFYTTWLFRLERLVLHLIASRPSSDRQIRDFAEGTSDGFAAWAVEARMEDQLLVRDISGRTRSWFMIKARSRDNAGTTPTTRLYFGSAVVPRRNKKTNEPELGPVFGFLLGFHKCYSRALLSAAAARLRHKLPILGSNS